MFDSLKAKTAMFAGAALLVTSLAASVAPAYAGERDDHHKPALSQNTDQDAFANFVYSDDYNESEIEDNAFRHATGVMQVNQASGVGNQQNNEAYIDGGNKSKGGDGGDKTTSTYGGGGDKSSSDLALRDRFAQDAGFNGIIDNNYQNETSIEDNAFRHATGLAQVNQAAGNLNQNGNAAAITDDDLSSSKVSAHQGLFLNCVGSETYNTATISNWAFAHFSGVAQVNQASGDLNQNQNQVSVAK